MPAYCESQANPKRRFDSRSFRWIRSGDAKLLVGCPRGQWAARKQECKTGTMLYKKLTPANGGRCPRDSRRVKKKA